MWPEPGHNRITWHKGPNRPQPSNQSECPILNQSCYCILTKKSNWLVNLDPDWSISTNQKITQIIFWLVKNGMTRNTQISLPEKYTMAPGHQLHHLYIRAHSTRPQHQYLRILTEYFCLWRVTYSDESAQAFLYHFPGPQASLHPPPPTLLTFQHHLKISSTAWYFHGTTL